MASRPITDDLEEGFEQANPPHAGFIVRLCGYFACPCVLWVGPQPMDGDDPMRKCQSSTTSGSNGQWLLLEIGIFGVRKDLDSVGARFLTTMEDLSNDGIQQNRAQHHSYGSGPVYPAHRGCARFSSRLVWRMVGSTGSVGEELVDVGFQTREIKCPHIQTRTCSKIFFLSSNQVTSHEVF